MRLRPAALAFLVLGACKGQNVTTVQPTLVVGGLQAFPLTAFGQGAQATLTLGATTAVDVQCTLSLDGGAFSLSPSGAVTVPGSGSLPVTVTFAPPLPSPIPNGAQPFAGSIGIASNDPRQPFRAVSLTGAGEAPRFALCRTDGGVSDCPDGGALTIDFGALAPRQSAGAQELALENLAAGVPLTVSSLTLDPAAQAAGYAIAEAVHTPLTLSARQALELPFHVTLNPQVAGATALGHLLVVTDDPRADGGAVTATLTAVVQANQPPIACLGITEIDYVDGHAAAVDPAQPLASQPSVTPPGPLDAVVLTAQVSATCSFDPQDHQNLAYAFGLAAPIGSASALQPVAGHPEEQRVQLDLPGSYVASVTATDSAQLSATAQLDLPVVPQSDLEAVLQWSGDHQVDLDLHLVRQLTDAGTGAVVDDPSNDCFWCNCLLAANYTGASPCGSAYGTKLQWGAVSSPLAGNPLLVANHGFQPLPSQNLDDARLQGPQAGATYGLYVHYYQAFASVADGGCGTSADCAGATCWAGECVPDTQATLRLFVAGQDLFDGGPPLTQTLREPCDLWHAADLTWSSGGHLTDGGFAPPVFTFSPITADGGLGSNGPQTGLTCAAK